MKLVTLPLGKPPYEPGIMLRDVYLPIDSMVSLLCVPWWATKAAGRIIIEAGIQPRRRHPAFIAALHTSPANPGGTNCRV
jgi:hypothetical protein